MQKRRDRRILAGLGLAVVLVVSLGWLNQGTEAETAVTVRGEIDHYVEEVGEVECKDATTVYLQGSGLIREIYVEENQSVKKGDLIMVMEQEQLDLARQNAEETLNGARSRYVAEKEAYQTMLTDFTNTKFLAEQGAVSQWELTQKEAALKSAAAALAVYQAELDQAELNLRDCSITLGKQQIVSPADGTILEKFVERNELGTPGTAAFVIGNSKTIEVKVNILADEAAEIQLGDQAEIMTRTETPMVIEGIVDEIAPTAVDEISSLGVNQKKVAVTIRTVDPSAQLKVGSEVDVRVVTESKAGVIIVPAGSIFDYEGGSCVFVIDSGKAIIRTVEKGIGNEDDTEITGGLKEGEIVLAAPDNNIKEGMRIRVSS